MNPPIREKSHIKIMLWKAIRDDVADMIGSDHAPHSLENNKDKEYPQILHLGCQEFKRLVPRYA